MQHDKPADGLLLPLPRLADDGGRRKLVVPGLALVVDAGGGTNLMSGGERSPPVAPLSPRFSATQKEVATGVWTDGRIDEVFAHSSVYTWHIFRPGISRNDDLDL